MTLIHLCRACIDEYNIPHPSMQVYGEKCDCCDSAFISCYVLSLNKVLTNFNKKED